MRGIINTVTPYDYDYDDDDDYDDYYGDDDECGLFFDAESKRQCTAEGSEECSFLCPFSRGLGDVMD